MLRTAVFANGLLRNAYAATIVVWSETLNARVDPVASDVVRHAFNR